MTQGLDRYGAAAIERLDGADIIQELESRFAMAVRQRDLLENYIKGRLHPGKHFYKVPGSEKLSLNKEGAELICLAHAYKPEYDQVAGPNQPPEDNAPYQITVKCRLVTNRGPAGEGLGSASSHITKRDGNRVPRQNDPGLRHNATLKMAQKSAYIAVTLNATAASEFFTQDLEDIETPSPESSPVKSAHYCAEHDTAWFKRGSMRGYAHPIDGQPGKWCNEPDEPPQGRVVDQAPRQAPQDARSAPSDQAQGQTTGPAPQDPQQGVQQRPAGFCEGHQAPMVTSARTKKVGHLQADGNPCFGIPTAENAPPSAQEIESWVNDVKAAVGFDDKEYAMWHGQFYAAKGCSLVKFFQNRGSLDEALDIVDASTFGATAAAEDTQ
jgi:hypothetical protein